MSEGRNLCECYAFISDNGRVIVESEFKTPEDAWEIGLGWPSKEEIEWNKKRGARVVRVAIIEIEG